MHRDIKIFFLQLLARYIARVLLFLFIIVCSGNAHAQIISTVAGNGAMGYGGDGGPAILATLYLPEGLAVDSIGNVYIADQSARIRKISTTGIITTVAGDGISGFSGDGGPATLAELHTDNGVACDGMGNLYIADNGSDRIRKVDVSGIITTFAGTGAVGYSGDGGPATNAQFANVDQVTTDKSGNVYTADEGNHCIRKISTAGIITTVAGTGTAGFSGDGGAATAAQLNDPHDMAVDTAGNLYIADTHNCRIRKVNTSGIITTFAGTGVPGYSGDGIPATAAEISYLYGVAADAFGNVYLSDNPSNDRIRKVNAAGIITTIAGTGVAGFSGDGGPATAAMISTEWGVARYGNGNIYFSDRQNNRIRMISSRPYFVNGHFQSVTFCHGTLNVDTLLAANDSNTGNTETWSLIYGPFHGTASVGYTTVSTGSVIIPTGLTYTSTPGFTGTDTFRVRVTDGIISDTTTIYLTVQGTPHAGIISGPDTVCEPASITLNDTASGGVWSASNSRAFVSAGIITGVSAGPDTISYTVTNTCGTAVATYVVTVKGCTAAVSNINANEAIKIYPNPNDGTFTLSFSSIINEEAHITITNMVGEKIKEMTTTTNTPLNIQLDAPAGVYFLSVNTSEGRYNTKVIVVK